jgi:hypothetical protein
VIRPTAEDRDEFRKTCGPAITAAAAAMRGRFAELGTWPPFDPEDSAWADLADIAVSAWHEVANTPFDKVEELYERHPEWA